MVANGQGVEAESLIFIRALTAGGVPTGPTITITVFSQGGNFSDVWGFSSDIPLQGGLSYTKTGGNNLGTAQYNTFVACFAGGTKIATPAGQRAIETLCIGDMVVTRDNGAMPIRWIGKRRLAAVGAFAPIHFSARALDNDAPLCVSPEHRMLVQDPILEMLFGTPRALVAAKHLVGLPGVTRQEAADLTYHHLMFDSHQMVLAAGCWSESFFLGTTAVSGLEPAAKAELLALFPSLKAGQSAFGVAAETVLKSHEAELLKSFLMRTELALAA